MRGVVLLLMVVGCGRVGFDPIGGGGDDINGGDGGLLGDGNGASDGSAGAGPIKYTGGGHDELSSTMQLNPTITGTLPAGSAIIVSVGWRDVTSTVTSLTDTAGTAYTQISTTARNGTVSQSVYAGFAPSTVTNYTTTVLFSNVVTNASVRIAIYSGVDGSAALQGGSGSGNGTSISAAGFLPAANWMIVATNTSDVGVASVAGGWMTRITSAYQDVVIDQSFSTSGIKTASATLASAGNWVMHAVQLPPK
jgi:hypothetical protein